MAAPPRPWQNVGSNYRITSNYPTPPGFSRAPIPSTSIPSTLPTRNVHHQQPPPVPARTYRHSAYSPMMSSTYPSYGSYGGYSGLSGYGSYGGYGGYSGYGGYGGYGGSGYGYGGYGVGMNRYGGYQQRPELESRFIRLAEESTRPAFQSIESLVQAFSSVTFMLESTFGAIHNSFRAVLSVAENMGRLRSVFSQLFSAFAIFRTLQWLYKKCLYLLGILKCDPSQDDIWLRAASRAEEQQEAAASQSRFSWPVLVLMGIMLSGPYLMWKLFSTLSASVGSGFSFDEWKKSNQPVTLAVAEYDFKAANEEELSLNAGDRVLVAPMNFQAPNAQQSGWFLATVDGKKAGYVPVNYLRLTGKMHYNRTVPVKMPQQKQHNAMAAAFPHTPETPEVAWQPATDIASVHVEPVSEHTSVNGGTSCLANRSGLEMPMPRKQIQQQQEEELLQEQLLLRQQLLQLQQQQQHKDQLQQQQQHTDQLQQLLQLQQQQQHKDQLQQQQQHTDQLQQQQQQQQQQHKDQLQQQHKEQLLQQQHKEQLLVQQQQQQKQQQHKEQLLQQQQQHQEQQHTELQQQQQQQHQEQQQDQQQQQQQQEQR